MALKATIYKADVQIADMDRQYYQDHALTLARHPSETDERLMVRLLAFVLNADAALVFGRGLSAEDEPDLWRKDLTGAVELWIDVGLPDEKSIRKACGRAGRVRIYSYGRAAELWWNDVQRSVERANNLEVMRLTPASTQALAQLARRSMQLQCTIQDAQLWLTDGQTSAHVEPEIVFQPAARRT